MAGYIYKKNLQQNESVESQESDETANNDEEEIFYPNAVHCMLALYRNKYQKYLQGELLTWKDSIWSELSAEMEESYFVFEAEEIKKKFKELRTYYFNMRTVQEIRAFEYFEALHEIYQHTDFDLLLKELISTSPNAATDTELLEPQTGKYFYADDCLFTETPKYNTNDAEVEDNLAANREAMWIKLERPEQDDNVENARKRLKTDKIQPIVEIPLSALNANRNSNNIKEKDITLCDFNIQQERRHREQMQLWRQFMQKQEYLIEQQKHLLEELIKRF